MTLAQLAKKLGQVRLGGPVRLSVSDVSEILGEPGGDAPQTLHPGSPLTNAPPPAICLTSNSWNAPTSGGSATTTKITWAMRRPRLPRRCARTAGYLCWQTAWAARKKGEVASKTAVESMVAGFHDSKDGESHPSVLQRLVQQANHRFLRLP